jgi:hypothetical protein
MKSWRWMLRLAVVCVASAQNADSLEVRITWGEDAKDASPYYVKLLSGNTSLNIETVSPIGTDDKVTDSLVRQCGQRTVWERTSALSGFSHQQQETCPG